MSDIIHKRIVSMLDDFFISTKEFIKLNNLDYKRYFFSDNNLEHRLNIIVGARGIGKTTLMARYINTKKYNGLKVAYA